MMDADRANQIVVDENAELVTVRGVVEVIRHLLFAALGKKAVEMIGLVAKAVDRFEIFSGFTPSVFNMLEQIGYVSGKRRYSFGIRIRVTNAH
jgi:hypothetical protein